MSLRFPPNKKATLTVAVAPKTDWPRLIDIVAVVYPPVAGLSSVLTKKADTAEVELEFTETPEFDVEQYPVEATLRILANFKDLAEPRMVEKELIVRPRKKVIRPPRLLNDPPTFLRIASRQPVRLLSGGPDTHVKIVWDGKDYLTFDPNPAWTFAATCRSHSSFPAVTFTKPANGRFEALLHQPAEMLIGTKLDFEVAANGPSGATLVATFAAEIVAPAGPKKQTTQIPVQGQRRPPYKLMIVTEDKFDLSTRWGDSTWDSSHAGAFIEPKTDATLTLCINQDFGLLKKYMEGVVAKKADEQRTEEKKTKYISHIAYHLYQMYLAKDETRKKAEADPEQKDIRIPEDDDMQDEVNRVGSTLIRLMEVTR